MLSGKDTSDSVSYAVCGLGGHLDAVAIIAPTKSGRPAFSAGLAYMIQIMKVS
jgi:pyruvate kinase